MEKITLGFIRWFSSLLWSMEICGRKLP